MALNDLQHSGGSVSPYEFSYWAVTQTLSFLTFGRPSLPRRIHISRATLDCLEGSYKTEDGHGRDRNEFLLKYNIDTFLICPDEEAQNADLHRPPKVHKTHRRGNQEIPFGNPIDMNSVGETTSRSGFQENCF